METALHLISQYWGLLCPTGSSGWVVFSDGGLTGSSCSVSSSVCLSRHETALMSGFLLLFRRDAVPCVCNCANRKFFDDGCLLPGAVYRGSFIALLRQRSMGRIFWWLYRSVPHGAGERRLVTMLPIWAFVELWNRSAKILSGVCLHFFVPPIFFLEAGTTLELPFFGDDFDSGTVHDLETRRQSKRKVDSFRDRLLGSRSEGRLVTGEKNQLNIGVQRGVVWLGALNGLLQLKRRWGHWHPAVHWCGLVLWSGCRLGRWRQSRQWGARTWVSLV